MYQRSYPSLQFDTGLQRAVFLTESSKSPASSAGSNKQRLANICNSLYAQRQKKGVPVMKEKLKAFALAAWSPQEKILLAADLLLAGVLIGWLTSPLKGGIRWFCDNSFGGKFYESAEAEEEEEV